MPDERAKREDVDELTHAKLRGDWTGLPQSRPLVGTPDPGVSMGDDCAPADELDLRAPRSARFPKRGGIDRDKRSMTAIQRQLPEQRSRFATDAISGFHLSGHRDDDFSLSGAPFGDPALRNGSWKRFPACLPC